MNRYRRLACQSGKKLNLLAAKGVLLLGEECQKPRTVRF